MHTSENNKTENGFIKLAPRREGRIIQVCKKPTIVEYMQKKLQTSSGEGFSEYGMIDNEQGKYTLFAPILLVWVLAALAYIAFTKLRNSK